MAKVRQRPVPFPAKESGGQLWTYPAFSAAAQETRDGGGTWEGAATSTFSTFTYSTSRVTHRDRWRFPEWGWAEQDQWSLGILGVC